MVIVVLIFWVITELTTNPFVNPTTAIIDEDLLTIEDCQACAMRIYETVKS